MPFKTGQSGNPKGRKRGTPNKTTIKIREIIRSIISSNFSKTKIARDLKELSPKQRLDYMLQLMEYILPKPKSVEPESERPMTMNEKYSRITEYIHSCIDKSDGNSDKPKGKGGLVTIISGNHDKNKGCNDL